MSPMFFQRKDAKTPKVAKKNRTSFLCVALRSLLLCISLSCAGAELDSFEDFLKMAQENNPGVQAAYHRWQAQLSKANVVGSLPDPKLTYSYFIESVETRVGPQEQRAGFSQQLPWFGKLDARQKAQLARADSAYEQYRAALLKLDHDMRVAYAKCWLLHRETDLTTKHIQLLVDIERVAENRVRAGASASEVIKTRLERAQLEERRQTFEEKQIPINAELNALLNRDSRSSLPLIHDLDFRSIGRDPIPSVQANPSLIALQHDQTGASADIRAARKEELPNLTLGIEWIGIGDAAISVKDSGKDAWMAGIGINLPLWRGKYNADIERATYMRHASDFMYQQRANELQAERDAAVADYHEALRKITLYKDTILPQVEQLLDLGKTDYRSGKASFLDLIDTQRSILRYQLKLAHAQADSQIHLAKIEMLIGKEFRHEK